MIQPAALCSVRQLDSSQPVFSGRLALGGGPWVNNVGPRSTGTESTVCEAWVRESSGR